MIVVNGAQYGRGSGSCKKIAKQRAALEALETLITQHPKLVGYLNQVDRTRV